MDTNFDRVESIFAEAVERHLPAEWDSFLASACGDDIGLRQKIERLLQAHARQGSPIDVSPIPPDVTECRPVIAERPGTQIGPYKLLQQIGEGGMGVVFMAEQMHPVRRTVALKIIKPGMDTRQIIARFEAERQALALMDHSNIARVLDAGTTETNRPYFVMELVKGVPITTYCDEHQLTPRQRLELFIPVCQAVQHAHQKGIIHRDLKPSNVMIALYDGRPVPKVIDFGVAKAAGSKLTEKTLFTEFGAVLGTLEYMSPEQAELNQLDVDTRSDIYSLGVLLYELLTGTTPLERKRLKETALQEVLRIIREEEPPKPSTRITSTVNQPAIAASRGLEPKQLSGLVRGELDWIVMKALEKDRSRRYETANGLMRDIERYLADEPVQACPPSAAYRLRKLARRHKVALATSGIVAASLILCTVISVWQAMVARCAEGLAQERLIAETEARQQATDEAAKAIATSSLLQKLLQSADPDKAKGADYTRRELLDDVPVELGDQLKDPAAIHATIGNAYRKLGLLDKAEPHLKKALDLQKQVLGPDNVEVAQSACDYAQCLYDRHDDVNIAESEKLARDALAIHRTLGVKNAATIQILGLLQKISISQRRLDEAKDIGQQALEIARQQPEQPPETAVIFEHLAIAHEFQGDLAQGLSLARESVKLHRRLQGDNHPETARGLFVLSRMLRERGEYAEAEQCCREALNIFLRQFDDSHTSVRNTIGNLESILNAKQDQAGLVALRAERIERLKQSLKRNLADSDLQNEFAWSLATDDSPVLRDGPSAVSFAERAVAGTNRQNANYLDTLAASYAEAGQFDKAVSAQQEAIGLLQDLKMKEDYATRLKLYESKKPYRDRRFFTSAKHQRAIQLARHAQWKEAAAGFAEEMELEPDTASNWWDLALLLVESGDLTGYEKHRQAMLAKFGETTEQVVALWTARAVLLRPITAEESVVVSRLAKTAVKEEGLSPWKECVVGLSEYRQGHFDKALEWMQKAVARSGESNCNVQSYLVMAMAHHRLNRSNEAHMALGKACEIVETKLPKLDSGYLGLFWSDWLITQILLREAKQLVEGNSATSSPKQAK